MLPLQPIGFSLAITEIERYKEEEIILELQLTNSQSTLAQSNHAIS